MGQERRHILAERAYTLRTNMTYAEKKLWFGFLREYPVSFVCQKVIGGYIVDFYCRKSRLSIELDGDSHFSERQENYDALRTAILESMEIKELRFTNSDIYENFEGVCEKIHQEVEARRNDRQGDLFQVLLNKH